jgi:hypothetical protein
MKRGKCRMLKLKREIKKSFSLSKILLMHFYQSSKSNIQVYFPLWYNMFIEQNIIIASPGRHDIKAS